jgi:hypothetical protein
MPRSLPFRFPIKILYAFLISPIRVVDYFYGDSSWLVSYSILWSEIRLATWILCTNFTKWMHKDHTTARIFHLSLTNFDAVRYWGAVLKIFFNLIFVRLDPV